MQPQKDVYMILNAADDEGLCPECFDGSTKVAVNLF